MNIDYYDQLAQNVGEYQDEKYRQRVEDEREREEEGKEQRENIISAVAPMSEEMIRHGGMKLLGQGFEKAGLKNSAKIVKFLGSNPKDWAKQLYEKGRASVQDQGQDLLRRGQEGLRNRIRGGGANQEDGGDESLESIRSRLTNSFRDRAGTSRPEVGDVEDNPFRLQNFSPRANVSSENPQVATRTTPEVSEQTNLTRPPAEPQGEMPTQYNNTEEYARDQNISLTPEERSSLPDFEDLNITTQNAEREELPSLRSGGDELFSTPRTIRQGVGSGTPQGQSEIDRANQQASQAQSGQDAMNSQSDRANSNANEAQNEHEDGGNDGTPPREGEPPETNDLEDGFTDAMEGMAETGEAENPIGLLVEAGLGIGALFASLYGTKQNHNNPVAPPKVVNPSVGFGLRPSQ